MKWVLLIFFMFVTIPLVFGMANYGALDFGECDYGENSPPDIDAFQPTDVTPTIINGTNSTFNITFSDCESDTVKLEWFFNTTLNQTNGNWTFNRSEVGIWNVTANVSDTYDDTYQEWTVTVKIIIIITPIGNISDVLIVPSISTVGNLMFITANITSINENFTGLYAYLNINEDFVFLTESPQNQSIGDVYTTNITQVRWFLATPQAKKRYNINITYTNETTTYQGENEKLVITAETGDNMALGTLVLIPLFIALFLLIVSWMIDPEKYWALKLGMILLGFVFIFQAYNFNNLIISEFFTSNNITNAIGDATWIYGMSFVGIFIIFLITFIYDIFMMFSGKKHKTGGYNNDE